MIYFKLSQKGQILQEGGVKSPGIAEIEAPWGTIVVSSENGVITLPCVAKKISFYLPLSGGKGTEFVTSFSANGLLLPPGYGIHIFMKDKVTFGASNDWPIFPEEKEGFSIIGSLSDGNIAWVLPSRTALHFQGIGSPIFDSWEAFAKS